ncbi:MAG: CAP domain-containing protein, partial [Aestuariivirga sp.]|nr:CAP domain-containing protein [Aestuariivirga sp.]
PDGSRFRPDLEAELASLVSAYRVEEGKEPITPDDAFQTAARAHAADMMINGFMGHSASTGQGFQARMRAFVGDVTKYPSLGENAARDTQDTPVDERKARALFQQWVKSRTHRRVMVNRSFRFVSTGVIQRDNKIWAVQIFFGTPREKGLFQ